MNTRVQFCNVDVMGFEAYWLLWEMTLILLLLVTCGNEHPENVANPPQNEKKPSRPVCLIQTLLLTYIFRMCLFCNFTLRSFSLLEMAFGENKWKISLYKLETCCELPISWWVVHYKLQVDFCMIHFHIWKRADKRKECSTTHISTHICTSFDLCCMSAGVPSSPITLVVIQVPSMFIVPKLKHNLTENSFHKW